MAIAMAFMASAGVSSFVVVMPLTCPPAATAMLQAVADSTLGNSMSAMKSCSPRLMKYWCSLPPQALATAAAALDRSSGLAIRFLIAPWV